MSKTISVNKSVAINKKSPLTERLASELISLYAGGHGKIFSTLQYLDCYFNFYRLGDYETASTLFQIIVAEMEHTSLLINALKNIGYTKRELQNLIRSNEFYYSTERAKKQTPRAILLDQLICEMSCLKEYKRATEKIKEPKILAMLNQIIADEESHVQIINKLLAKR